MIVAPLQRALGDVIFTQTLLHLITGPADKIIWATEPHYVDGLNRAYPKVLFMDYNKLNIDDTIREDKVIDGIRHLPFRWAATSARLEYKDEMGAKYPAYGFDTELWRDNAMYNRDMGRETMLMKKVGVRNGMKFNLISCNYQSDFGGAGSIKIDNGLPNIYLQPFAGFSLFDWSLLIEGATTIHAVSSSILYILELLDTKAELHLYPRDNDLNFECVNYLFTKKYILH